MVDRRDHGADQSGNQGCAHESANRITDDLTADSISEENSAVGNSQIERGTLLLSLNMHRHSSFEQSEAESKPTDAVWQSSMSGDTRQGSIVAPASVGREASP